MFLKKLYEKLFFEEQYLFIPEELKQYSYDYYMVPSRGGDNASVVLFSKL